MVAMSLSAQAAVNIVHFRPETRALRAGDVAISELTVRNAGERDQRWWIGYSVQGPRGDWFDVPAREVTVRARATTTERLAWTVPSESRAMPGAYRVVMAVWSAPPDAKAALRLASADQPRAFRVRSSTPLLLDEPRAGWEAAGHTLGRGVLHPEQVFVRDHGGFALRLLPNSCDGAEIRTSERYGFGDYEIRMKTPVAPGSLSAFFLYADAGAASDEIDIEIHNDGSRRTLLTSWIKGDRTRETVVTLPFDPSAAVHSYAIRWSPAELVFVADGTRLARWTGGYSSSPMRVLASTWWPAWLECRPLTAAADLIIDEIGLRPTRHD